MTKQTKSNLRIFENNSRLTDRLMKNVFVEGEIKKACLISPFEWQYWWSGNLREEISFDVSIKDR